MESPRRAPAADADTDTDAATPPIHALIVTDPEASLDGIPPLLGDEPDIEVTVVDAARALGRIEGPECVEQADHDASVDCVVRSYRSADADPPFEPFHRDDEGVSPTPTVLVCADGSEAARALSAGADRCVQFGEDRSVLTAHLASAIRRARTDHERERERREERAFVESALDTLPDVFFTFDLDDRLTHWNSRLNEVSGYTDAELETMNPADLVAEADVESVATAARRALDEGPIRREVTLVTRTNERIPYEVTSAPLEREDTTGEDDAESEVRGMCGIGRDISQRVARERELRAEQSFTESVLDAIPDVFYALDDRGDFLRWNDRLNEVSGYTDAELATIEPLSLVAGDDRAVIADAMATVFGGGEAQTRESALCVKGGEEIPYEFNGSALFDADGEICGLAGTARDVTDRRHRERALRHQAERLETLDRINAVIRDVDRALVRASTREEVERTVCERLARATPYRFAWIGDGDPVEARAWAGVEEGYLDDRRNVDGSDGVTARTAIRTGETQVVQHIADDPDSVPWREAALAREYESAAAVPLTYRDTTYGVCCVYAPRPNAFDDTERAVLSELGETIAYAISTAERRRALMTDTVIEVTFAIRDRSRFVLSLSADFDCHLALEGLVPQSDGSLVEFVTVRGTSAATITERAAAAGVEATLVGGGVDDVAGDGDGADGNAGEPETEHVFRFVAPDHDSSISAALADHGGVVTDASAEGGEARIVAEFPADTDVRAVVTALDAKYPNTELLARRERERTDASGARLRAAFADALTDRQHEVLKTAYLGGYFEWPREETGEDLAHSLDIAKPTFHEHLRTAERKLLTLFFDHRSPDSPPH